MCERKTIRKWFWVWDFEKEERWLNEMALSGWLLDRVGWCRYHVVRCQPGTYTVRLEMHEEDQAYIRFMEETGVEYIGRCFQWLYFRKNTADGEFDLFSDLDSRIAHLSKISKGLAALGAANLCIGFANTVSGSNLGWISLLCATVLMYGLGRIHGKEEALRQERLLRE